MINREEQILKIRGRDRYGEGMRHLRAVSNGAMEGALESFRTRAIRLMQLEAGLDDTQRTAIHMLLANNQVRTTEDALLALEQELQKGESHED